MTSTPCSRTRWWPPSRFLCDMANELLAPENFIPASRLRSQLVEAGGRHSSRSNSLFVSRRSAQQNKSGTAVFGESMGDALLKSADGIEFDNVASRNMMRLSVGGEISAFKK